jgi:hypothetical protein
MSIFDIYDTLVFGSFRCDNCDRPHPRKKRIWSNTAYPGYEFGSKKCLKEYERTQRKTAKKNSGLGKGHKSNMVYSSQSGGDLTIKGRTNMNDNNKILQKLLEAFRGNGFAQVKGYKRFGYLRETDTAVFVSRETGKDTGVPFDKILLGIEALQDDSNVYSAGPGSLRKYEITRITSPIWAMLHVLPLNDYRK